VLWCYCCGHLFLLCLGDSGRALGLVPSQVHPFLGFTNVLELQAQFLSSARSLSMLVLRGGGNWTCPLVTRGPSGGWVLVPPEDAVATLVTHPLRTLDCAPVHQ
jgi:hypothetical protein